MTFINHWYKLFKYFLIHRAGLFNKYHNAYYNYHQERLRGSSSVIRERLNLYLTTLADNKIGLKEAILDCGCGRGDFLNLLSDAGYKNLTGVDINSLSLGSVKNNSTKTVKADVNKYLYVADKTYKCITAFHLIEHMTFAELFDFLVLCRERLSPNGLLILETPNCDNLLVSAKTFNYDHTHKQKVTALFITNLLSYIGFKDIKTQNIHPIKHKLKSAVDQLLYCGQDLSITAIR